MTPTDEGRVDRIPLSSSAQNIYNGVLQDADPTLYLLGKSYQFHPMALSVFLPALEATILANPVQLCVLTPPMAGDGYPDLVARLQCGDIICVRSPDNRGADGLEETWAAGILATPLVRYTVHTDASDRVVAMHVHAHHILIDGASTAIIEADLARHLGGADQKPCCATALASLAAAHRSEAAKVARSAERFAAAVHRELTDQVRRSNPSQGVGDAIAGTAGRGVLRESVRVDGSAYDAIVALADSRQVPLNALVTTAAAAVHARLRQSTESLLVHPVDNRFGEPQLDVATCLVNSVAQLVRFPPFASVGDVVAMVDRGYVKAVRRRWFREERYRRMYLAINRSAHVEPLTVNFMRGRCAPELKPYLSEPPLVTDIGPVEGMTVACIHDDAQHTLDFAIWNRLDAPERTGQSKAAECIVAALQSMAERWDEPIALTVGEWYGLSADGRLETRAGVPPTQQTEVPAWFLAALVDLERCRSPGVDSWIVELVRSGAEPGDVMVFVDDDSHRAIELLIACHLAGCGYSVCAEPDELELRADAIAEHCGVAVHVVEIATARAELDEQSRKLVDDRIDQVAQDDRLAAQLAYVMPTSGSTGEPKLVPVTHGSLAVFCAAARDAYGWGPTDTVLQCAPLTSDISVEEVFVALYCGARLARSAAMRMGDLPALVLDAAANLATVLDLPTAIWHLLCADGDALAALGVSALRQVIIGGEAIRPAAVSNWLGSAAAQRISLISTYGPTETTVVVTHLSIGADEQSQTRLGRPLISDSVFVGFGEVVVVGELVSPGYLGMDSATFGTVQAPDGSRYRAFATADRVARDGTGFPMLVGRRDAVLKVAGKRVDTAELLRQVAADPDVTDVAVEPGDNGLGIWIQTRKTRTADDPAAVARIRHIARTQGLPSFTVAGVPEIPRKSNGKVDRAKLTVTSDLPIQEAGGNTRAIGLAEIWSRQLGRPIRSNSSLLDEGIGSLDLIRILPETRRYLDWQLSILDLIGADTAANVVDCRPAGDAWMDDATAAEIAHDLAVLEQARLGAEPGARRRPIAGAQTIVILGATGILGTGFARAVADLKRRGQWCPDIAFVTRSPLSEHGPWTELGQFDGVKIAHLPDRFTAFELGALLDDVGAHTLVNCVGNTNVLVPYRDLRAANVDAVSSITEACVRRGTRMVHLSTFVVNADVAAAAVTDPRVAPYPYAASKSLAELVVTRTADELDFTVVRLPRVLGDSRQLDRSADILVSILDACIALRVCPVVPLVEEVTTSVAAANCILGLLPELSPAIELGRGMTVLRGEKVRYTEFLGSLGFAAVDIAEWKYRLDQSEWARANPLRWAVLDAWVGLGARLAGHSYTDYLAGYPSIDVGFESVAEAVSTPPSIHSFLAPGAAQVVRNSPASADDC